MAARAHLASARQRLLGVLRQLNDERLAERALVREPLTEAQEQYAARRVKELGLDEKADRLLRSE